MLTWRCDNFQVSDGYMRLEEGIAHSKICDPPECPHIILVKLSFFGGSKTLSKVPGVVVKRDVLRLAVAKY